MLGINACGRGCCTFHVGVAAAKRALDTMQQRECQDMTFADRQCPECLALIDVLDEMELEEGATEECNVCGKDVRAVRPGTLTPSSPEHALRTDLASADSSSGPGLRSDQ